MQLQLLSQVAFSFPNVSQYNFLYILLDDDNADFKNWVKDTLFDDDISRPTIFNVLMLGI